MWRPTFPPKVSHLLHVSEGVELLGSPIFGSTEFCFFVLFDKLTVSLFHKVRCLQKLLPGFEDPQVELQLLHQCLNCCNIVYILRTVLPHLLSQLSDFDNLLRSSPARVVHYSLHVATSYSFYAIGRFGYSSSL